ncbi:hypothetical protein [Maricaulis sp.]|uniref:hypothetical protein n=1 Tax=Maricaulis sp. TaxID=1486257 RepID=UPI003A951234
MSNLNQLPLAGLRSGRMHEIPAGHVGILRWDGMWALFFRFDHTPNHPAFLCWRLGSNATLAPIFVPAQPQAGSSITGLAVGEALWTVAAPNRGAMSEPGAGRILIDAERRVLTISAAGVSDEFTQVHYIDLESLEHISGVSSLDWAFEHWTISVGSDPRERIRIAWKDADGVQINQGLMHIAAK